MTNSKKAIIVAMATITGATIRPTSAAARAAIADMTQDMGEECVCPIEDDPFITFGYREDEV